MNELLIRNVSPFGGERMDLYIVNGRFADSRPDRAVAEIDGSGCIALPGLVEAHTHLDKNLIGMDWFENRVGPTRNQRIIADRRAKQELGIDARRQAAQQILQTLAFGVLHIRSHVDVDTEIGISNIEGVVETRNAFEDLVDVQIVAFPQSGMLVRDGTLDLMDAALKAGADIVGGIDPASIDRDPIRHLDAIFALAERHGKPVDIHLHEPGDLGAFCLELIIERTRALSMRGKVMVSHAYCLGMLDAGRQQALIDLLAAEGVAIMTVGSPSAPALPLRAMRRAGIVLASGSDGIQGTWEPWGNGDMLERAKYLAQRNGMTNDTDLAEVARICTLRGAEGIALADYGLSSGCYGDVVLVPARTLAEAVALTPQRRTVIRRGRIVVRDGVPSDQLSHVQDLTR
ncbi:amidohydrolase [Rhizobium lusitanum]|uniref:Cytosine/adenosine deaminase-related metal-dependent hydrolase n=1 Tax=Rhizobium lusitanum TaxID=293958 RepID=A0A7X0MD63_9HYPH|nr:amidohydrolase [Rhizobium lusitanum]MBB6486294.1 cytosine/adenosine deaminase-related metal-dependent hydrolase [Rhizobium lusitanum]